MRITLSLLSVLSVSSALAQPAPSPAARIDYPSVAAALKDLESQDGNGTIVTHSDEWTVVNESRASAQWSFTLPGNPAHPAVVRRVIQRDARGAVTVETTSLCEAPQSACNKLLEEFAALNGRITQAVKARSRQGSTPPAQ